MLKVKKQSNCFFNQISYSRLLKRKRIHILIFLCWIFMILLGTFLIGISTNLYSQQFTFCTENQTFCNKQFTLDSQKKLFIYVIIENFYQNNRMFLDSYSPLQFQGKVHNNYHCQNFDTYANLNINTNAGGYRVSGTNNAFPCGKVMLNMFNDVIYLITSEGGSIQLDSEELISQYNRDYKFMNLDNYQLKQWVDIQSSRFVNYFTVPFTSTKHILVGKVDLKADSYQLIIKNNYKTNGVLNKRILISEMGGLGGKDAVIGFYLFVSGILVLFFHLLLCCKGIKF